MKAYRDINVTAETVRIAVEMYLKATSLIDDNEIVQDVVDGDDAYSILITKE